MSQGKPEIGSPICFSSKKSKQKVLKLFEEMKSSYSKFHYEPDPYPFKVIDRISCKCELFLASPGLSSAQLPPSAEKPEEVSTAALKPFLLPSCPASIPFSLKKATKYFEVKRNIMLETRQQHHRLLSAFQDRVTNHLVANEGSFCTAMAHIAAEDGFPAAVSEKRTNSKAAFASIVKESQKFASSVVEDQQNRAKIQYELELFEERHCEKGCEGTLPIQVTCPFSFLIDTGSNEK